jgi:S1-C subfamily serine protease
MDEPLPPSPSSSTQGAAPTPNPQAVGRLLVTLALCISLAALVIAISSILVQAPDEGLRETGAIDIAVEAGGQTLDPLFDQPSDVTELVQTVKASVVLIECGSGAGTGWIIDSGATPNIRSGRDSNFRAGATSFVVTADHVISDCKRESSSIEAYIGAIPVEARLLNWHKREDLALLAINIDRHGLQPSVVMPQASWVMSIGYPWEFDYPVPLIGRLVDSMGSTQYVDMTIQPGNSGSPIVNAKGQVIATAVASLEDPQSELSVGWTVAVTTDALCLRLFDCSSRSITSSESKQ